MVVTRGRKIFEVKVRFPVPAIIFKDFFVDAKTFYVLYFEEIVVFKSYRAENSLSNKV